ncbi:MAG: helicase-related protein, partial [bacterium]
GDRIEIHPAYDDYGIRVDLDFDQVVGISRFNVLTGELIEGLHRVAIYPAKHFITTYPRLEEAMESIRRELEIRLTELRHQGKLLEAQRLEQRTRFDLEMLSEIGYCNGIENYSRHLSGRKPGEPPYTLLDYFPADFLLIVDESHVAVPQIRGMIGGDLSRKRVLVEYGFRLPSALDNRPLTLEEWEEKAHQVIFVSATPGEWEIAKSGGVVVEQIIRPTGLMDPAIEVRPTEGQIDDLIEEIHRTVERGERVLITTLTKRMSEDLTEYLSRAGIRVRYLHSEIESLERVEILRELRKADFDVLVGINLLREGLDLPEVSLVIILDADKEGFLRSERSLMQIAGRAARNSAGRVIFYADSVTQSMRKVIEETERRRRAQEAYNKAHNIIPTTIRKTVEDILKTTAAADARAPHYRISIPPSQLTPEVREALVEKLTQELGEAVEQLQFEKAAAIRDEILSLRGVKSLKDLRISILNKSVKPV